MRCSQVYQALYDFSLNGNMNERQVKEVEKESSLYEGMGHMSVRLCKFSMNSSMNEQQVSDCRVRAPFLWKLYRQVYPALYNFSLNSSMNRKKQVMMATICRLCLKKKEKKRKQKSKFYWCIV